MNSTSDTSTDSSTSSSSTGNDSTIEANAFESYGFALRPVTEGDDVLEIARPHARVTYYGVFRGDEQVATIETEALERYDARDRAYRRGRTARRARLIEHHELELVVDDLMARLELQAPPLPPPLVYEAPSASSV